MKKSKTIEVSHCDRCGIELSDDNHGEFYVTSMLNNNVHYESRLAGDYCKECIAIFGRIFDKAMVDAGITERYDKDINVDKELTVLNQRVLNEDSDVNYGNLR